MTKESETLERIIEFEPAYDRRETDPKEDGGIHGVQLRFVLKGPLGAVQFLLMTQWQLPHVQQEFRQRCHSGEQMPLVLFEPMPADLGYHSPRPMYEDHRPMGSQTYKWVEPPKDSPLGNVKVPEAEDTGTLTPCPYLDGKACYYDGSSLNSRPVFEALLVEGHEGVWRNLERYYRHTFEEREDGGQ